MPQKMLGSQPQYLENPLVENNGRHDLSPFNKSVIDLFEQQAVKTPESIAVVYGESRLTYRELNEQANRIAHYLQQQDITEEDLVPVCLQRSPMLIVSIVGILKAGAAYVPVDPDYPQLRIRHILQEAEHQLVITDEDSYACMRDVTQASVLMVSSPTTQYFLSTFPDSNPTRSNYQHRCSYIIYTSGSTGTPKGIQMPDSALYNLLLWQQEQAGYTTAYRILQFASINFDVSFQEIFFALCFGGSIHLISAQHRKDMQLLCAQLQQEAITTLFLPYVVLQSLAIYAVESGQYPQQLTDVFTAGEQLKLGEDIAQFMTATQARLHNQYGPSEAHVVTAYTIQPGDYINRPLPPIGKPVSNTTLYIVAADGSLCAPGEAGELYIGGVQVARGYLHRPELTAERFIANPFQEGGGRVYKTGDICRELPDGNIEYIGRKDNQVKIRGYRIEPGEIESLIGQSNLVTQTVVVIKEDQLRNKSIVAYVVPKEAFDADALRSFLVARLPDYMIPAIFLSLPSLPLTANGKVDKAALPDPDLSAFRQQTYVAPRTDTEHVLASIWERLLQLQQIGIHDHFFELGGHSLSAMRLQSMIRRQLKTVVSVKVLFEHPTIERMAAYLDQHIDTALPTDIQVYERPALLPLSFSQERLYFIDQLEGSVQYHIPLVWQLTGPLDIAALELALSTIVDRHESLRTVIRVADAQPYQYVLPVQSWQLAISPVVSSWQETAAGYINTPFDLSADHMLRAHLIPVDAGSHILLVVLHHIAADGWSLSILVRELTALYHSFTTQQPPVLTAPAIQYADYTIWQRQYLTAERLAPQLAYWKSVLQEVPALQLPTDFARPAIQSKQGAVHHLRVDKTLTTQLHHLAQQQGATLFMTLLAAFKVLLNRYSGQEDICVGIPASGRLREETADVIGFFINALAIRTSLQDQPSFNSFLSQVKERTLDAYEYQDVPFEQVVEATVRERDLSRSPLFQVMFVLQNLPDAALSALGEAVITEEVIAGHTSKFDLTFQLEETADGLRGTIEYCTALFTSATISNMSAHFQQLLQAITASPATPVTQLPYLSAAETTQLLSYNDVVSWLPVDETLVSLFQQQVTRTPDSIAVVYGEQEVSYHTLDQWSNQIAHYLLDSGCGQGQYIGLLSYRGIDMIAGILGILKSGNAYVPLHIDYPGERIRTILQDADITHILYTDEALYASKELAEGVGLPIAAAVDMPVTAPVCHIDSAAIAYIMYTSGTSGKPKGIAIRHRNVVKLAYEPGPISIQQGDKVLQWSNYAFDGSVYDIFSSLLHGATLYLISDAAAADIQQLSALIAGVGISHCFMTTALFNSFADTAPETFRHVKKLLFGGELVSPPHVEKVFAITGPGKLIHMYGPTETTVYATYHSIDAIVGTTIPIGIPLANTQLLVLDKYDQLVPAGVDGELYISGAGLAQGYVNNATLTAAQFRTIAIHAGRWYKTGDIVRRTENGELLYITRADDQVKIRGYRIETGEVEAALQRCTGISEALVIARTGADGTKWLAGYCLTHAPFDADRVNSELQHLLPAYMIPAVLLPVTHWPMTTNGKIDKKALPEPAHHHSTGSTYTAPRSSLESQLVNIWEALLPVKPIGIYDNFFAMGGHSLLVTRVISAIRRQLDTEVSIQDLFAFPTVATLAGHLQRLQKGDVLPMVTVQERPARIPLSYAQARLWFLDSMQGSVNYHIPELLLLDGVPDVKTLEATIRSIVQRHEVLRTVFHADEAGSYQIILPVDNWRLQVIATPFADVAAVTDFAGKETLRAFDLTADYLLRAYLLQIGPDKSALLFVLHHVAADGWSLSILLDELTRLYLSFRDNPHYSVPALPIQYADYALWQQQYLDGPVLDKQLSYWQDKLRGVAVLQLPTDYPRPAVQRTRGETFFYHIDLPLLEAVQQLSRQQGVTLFMTLLAAFKVLLHRYSGQDDICVGSPIANRTQESIESLIGFFVNTLALRSDLSGDPTFETLLAQVRTTLLEAYMHQDAPFEKVVEAVVNDRDRSRTPLFQVMFIQQNLPEMDAIALGDIPMRRELVPIYTSKFDLIVDSSIVSNGLQLRVELCSDIYQADTIHRMMTQYEYILRVITAAPATPLSRISLLSPAAAQQLLSTFNDTRKDIGPYVPVIRFFTQQAIRTPDAVAINYYDHTLSYRQLHETSNQIAHLLLESGVQAGDFVPVCMQRSIELIAAILGILKTGAAYVPVDPSYPQARIQHILADTNYPLIITDVSCYHLISAGDNSKVLVLSENEERLASFPVSDPVISDDPERCTYLIYTSGSTGTPKGVQMPDRALSNLLRWQRDQAAYAGAYQVLQYASINFDVSFQEIFFALSFGGSIHLVEEQERKDMSKLMQLINAHRITCLFLPYVVLQSLAIYAVENNNYPEHLQDIFTAGEQLKLGKDIELLLAGAGAQLHNHYGPSETHVVTSYTIQAADYEQRPLPPIGTPIYNTFIYILAADGSLCPVGVPGELYIGGVQVASGYLHLPALTAERFIADPFHGGRMYKTGDICRWLSDGNIEYLGRSDNQVKIRGYRIETGEIEQVLQACTFVKQALVIVLGEDTAEKALAAYVVPEGNFDKEAINDYLQHQLPAYMIPSFILPLEKIPLTNNGKIDKKALLIPEWNTASQDRYHGPRNAAEALLLEDWKSILPNSEFGIYHNFFAMGGNSILAIRLIARMQRSFQVTINDLFLYPNIADLSKHVVYQPDYLQHKLADLIQQYKTVPISTAPVSSAAAQQNYDHYVSQRAAIDLTARLNYGKVLLLGATGFLGIHLLYDLLHQHQQTVYVIVRTGSDEDPYERLAAKYKFYFGNRPDAFKSRLRVMKGDISLPYFGMDEQQFANCIDAVDAVINSAANVKHFGSYADFEAANVRPIQTLLTHFEKGSPKDIHHVSTTGVMGQRPHENEDILFTEQDIDKGQHISNFYVQSKLAAEQLLDAARGLGIRVNIYRVGHLTFQADTGIFQENISNNAFYNDIKGFITLGVIPQETGQLEISNVDQVSTAILRIFDKEQLLNSNYHVVNPHPVPIVQFADYLRDYGYDVTVVPMYRYLEQLQQAYAAHPDLVNRILLDAALFSEQQADLGSYELCAAATDTVLHQLGFKWLVLGADRIRLMLEHIERSGFLKTGN